MSRCRVSDPYTLLPITQFSSFLDVIFMSHSGRVPVAPFVAGPQKSTAHLQIRASLMTTQHTCLCQSSVCFQKTTRSCSSSHDCPAVPPVRSMKTLCCDKERGGRWGREEPKERRKLRDSSRRGELHKKTPHCLHHLYPSMNTFQRTDTELSNRWRDVNNHRNRSPVPPSLFFSTADSLRAFIGYKLDLVWRFAHLHLFTVKSLFWKWSVDSLKRSFMYFSVSFRDTKCERVARMCFQKCWNY